MTVYLYVIPGHLQEYTLSDLMQKAEEQEEHWRSVVRSKDEQINTLQYKSNGQQVSVLHIYLCLLNTKNYIFFSAGHLMSLCFRMEKNL